MELKTARLTILIDPAKKQAFEELCHTQDMTPSQVIRRLIRDFMESEEAPVARKAAVPRKGATLKAVPARKAAPARRR